MLLDATHQQHDGNASRHPAASEASEQDPSAQKDKIDSALPQKWQAE